jgi:formate-dependent nitrite reductase cytochrome c552 subunit
MEQMMEHLLAKMDTNQAKTDAALKEMKEEIRTNQARADTSLKEMK